MHKIDLTRKLGLFHSHWDPKVVASYNDNDVMVVKFQGEFPFHRHAESDDFFLVLKGRMVMEYEDAEPVEVGPGELVVVPAGRVHRPSAEAETHVLLIEPKGAPNTGDADRAPAAKEWI